MKAGVFSSIQSGAWRHEQGVTPSCPIRPGIGSLQRRPAPDVLVAALTQPAKRPKIAADRGAAPPPEDIGPRFFRQFFLWKLGNSVLEVVVFAGFGSMMPAHAR
jgi:hypothetical protein